MDRVRTMVWMDDRTLRLAGLEPSRGEGGRVVCLQEVEAALRARGLMLSEATRRLNQPAPRQKPPGKVSGKSFSGLL